MQSTSSVFNDLSKFDAAKFQTALTIHNTGTSHLSPNISSLSNLMGRLLHSSIERHSWWIGHGRCPWLPNDHTKRHDNQSVLEWQIIRNLTPNCTHTLLMCWYTGRRGGIVEMYFGLDVQSIIRSIVWSIKLIKLLHTILHVYTHLGIKCDWTKGASPTKMQ